MSINYFQRWEKGECDEFLKRIDDGIKNDVSNFSPKQVLITCNPNEELKV